MLGNLFPLREIRSAMKETGISVPEALAEAILKQEMEGNIFYNYVSPRQRKGPFCQKNGAILPEEWRVSLPKKGVLVFRGKVKMCDTKTRKEAP